MKKKQLAAVCTALALMGQSAAAATHTAVKGDTYWLIAKKYSVSLSDLLAANNASENTVLNIGDKVIIPSGLACHTAVKGDTYWLIAQKYSANLSDLLAANNASESTVLNIGDKVIIPSGLDCHTAVKGDTYWLIAKKYSVSLSDLLAANNASENTVLNIGDRVIIPSAYSSSSSAPYITYTSHTVKSNDTLWNIAIEYGIPFSELLEANSLSENSTVRPGTVLTVPVHHIPVTEAVSSSHGEYLDWWTQAQYLIPIGAEFTVYDYYSGKSFNAKRTVGANHADCETLTAADTAKMKEIWGGSFSWNKRPVLIIYNGRKIAASAAGMFHAGNEWADGGVWTDWRSDNYGPGINYDYVKGNDASGHFDLHFLNSVKHSDSSTDKKHQENIKIAAGK